MSARAFFVLPALLCAACPDQASSSAPAGSQTKPVAVCQHASQSCLYAPGKLGLCTMRDPDCDGSPGCLLCVSLH